jgi:uncharacterized protein (DUF488 family)
VESFSAPRSRSDRARESLPSRPLRKLATIGYEGTTVSEFLQTLTDARIELLVDVRAVAMSRRPGFAKSALAANLTTVDIEYLHLRKLGTPADGRAAARAGKHAEMHRIFLKQLATEDSQAELHALADIIKSGKRVCILCFEADPAHCHRRLVAQALQKMMPLEVSDLAPAIDD